MYHSFQTISRNFFSKHLKAVAFYSARTTMTVTTDVLMKYLKQVLRLEGHAASAAHY